MDESGRDGLPIMVRSCGSLKVAFKVVESFTRAKKATVAKGQCWLST